MTVKILIHDIPTPTDENGGYAEYERRYLQHCIDNGVPALVLVVGSQIGARSDLISILKEGVSKGLFVIANHGDVHSRTAWNPSTMTLSAQKTYIQSAQNKIHSALGVSPKLFVPPYYECTDTTIQACNELGLRVHTVSVGGVWALIAHLDAMEMIDPYHFRCPYTDANALRSALAQMEKDYGYVFWDIHPHHSAKAGESAINIELEVMKDYGAGAPTLAETIHSMINVVTGVMMLMMVASLMTSIVKAMKKE